MTLVLALLAVASISIQEAVSLPTGAHAETGFSTAFLSDDSTVDLHWNSVPDPVMLERLVPFRSGAFGMIDFRCSGLSVDGHLRECKQAKVEPVGAGYERAGRALLQKFTVSPSVAQPLAPKIKFILVQMRLWNSDQRDLRGWCWEPTCVTEGPPPPPPPVAETPDIKAAVDRANAV